MWDALWMSDEQAIHVALKPGRGTKYLTALTKRYLTAASGRILEGGCGLGHNVAALRRAGYVTVGIDFAFQTVAALNRIAPELGILLGDLRSLPFADNSFAGYWSLGVIEHFFYGYEALAAEMARVIRPGGYLFLTFPYMSPIRRFRARRGRYPAFQSSVEPTAFYQFALDPTVVVADFGRFGFENRYQSSMSGLEGIKDEVSFLEKPLTWLHDYTGRSVFLRGVRFVVGRIATFGAGHTCILVLQKS
jgi:SAM-dependent methyltransferase